MTLTVGKEKNTRQRFLWRYRFTRLVSFCLSTWCASFVVPKRGQNQKLVIHLSQSFTKRRELTDGEMIRTILINCSCLLYRPGLAHSPSMRTSWDSTPTGIIIHFRHTGNTRPIRTRGNLSVGMGYYSLCSSRGAWLRCGIS